MNHLDYNESSIIRSHNYANVYQALKESTRFTITPDDYRSHSDNEPYIKIRSLVLMKDNTMIFVLTNDERRRLMKEIFKKSLF